MAAAAPDAAAGGVQPRTLADQFESWIPASLDEKLKNRPTDAKRKKRTTLRKFLGEENMEAATLLVEEELKAHGIEVKDSAKQNWTNFLNEIMGYETASEKARQEGDDTADFTKSCIDTVLFPKKRKEPHKKKPRTAAPAPAPATASLERFVEQQEAGEHVAGGATDTAKEATGPQPPAGRPGNHSVSTDTPVLTKVRLADGRVIWLSEDALASAEEEALPIQTPNPTLNRANPFTMTTNFTPGPAAPTTPAAVAATSPTPETTTTTSADAVHGAVSNAWHSQPTYLY
jgi:hypothetical protein